MSDESVDIPVEVKTGSSKAMHSDTLIEHEKEIRLLHADKESLRARQDASERVIDAMRQEVSDTRRLILEQNEKTDARLTEITKGVYLKIDGLSERQTKASQTNWTAIGVLLTIISAFGYVTYQPMTKAIADLDAKLVTMVNAIQGNIDKEMDAAHDDFDRVQDRQLQLTIDAADSKKDRAAHDRDIQELQVGYESLLQRVSKVEVRNGQHQDRINRLQAKVDWGAGPGRSRAGE